MIDIPKITAKINTEEVETVELAPIVATIETKENFVELPKVVVDIRPETAIVGNLGTMVAGKGKDGKDGVDGRPGKDGIDGKPGQDGINGKDGKDGTTPHIGDNGNWFIDDFDTGVCAVGKTGITGAPGKDGYTPRLGIDYFNGKDGRDGVDGKPGKDGKNGRTPIKGIDYKDGKDGKDGVNGLNGTDGFSPKVLVEEIEGGHKITITDKDGEKSFEVMDGQGGNGGGGTGENGFSPTISVEEIENGHRITITDIDGTKTFDVFNGENGKDGQPGKDGYTPVKGVDYFDGEKGDPGYTPIKGLDYFDGADGQPGADGKDGSPGADGYTPQRGKDYWTDADKAEMIAALNRNFADYVIEAGVTGGWNWEKWNSGKYICWGTFRDTRTHYTMVNGFYGYYSSDFKYPITFPTAPIIHFNCKVGSGFAAPAGDVAMSTVQARCYALSTASGEVSCVWEMYVVGRWK